MKFHIIAFFAGFILDLILGDPYWLFHPIRLIGSLISGLEKKLLNYRSNEAAETDRNTAKELRRGAILVSVSGISNRNNHDLSDTCDKVP